MSQITAKQIHTFTICGRHIIGESLMTGFKVVPKFSSQEIIPDQITWIVDVKLPLSENTVVTDGSLLLLDQDCSVRVR